VGRSGSAQSSSPIVKRGDKLVIDLGITGGRDPVTQNTVEPRPDSRDILAIDRVFRGQLQVTPELISDLPEGDVERAQLIAAHYGFRLEVLHIHHEGEDRLLGPRLGQRAPVQGPLVERLEAPHVRIAELVPQVQNRLLTWSASADSAEVKELHGLIQDLTTTLAAHLGEEEQSILSLAAEPLSVEEWDQLSRKGTGSVAPDQLPIVIERVREYTPDFPFPRRGHPCGPRAAKPPSTPT
jgi:hypothetical protein